MRAVLHARPCAGSSTSTADAASASAAGLKLAQAVVNHYDSFPTKIAVTTPHKKAIPTGKSIVYITCGVATCNDIATVIGSAAKDAVDVPVRMPEFKRVDDSDDDLGIGILGRQCCGQFHPIEAAVARDLGKHGEAADAQLAG